MDPLPASEVRRRGTRMRRRNHVIATVGAVAAVAVIATPIALATGVGDTGRSTPEPAAPPTGWTTTIPDDFPIEAGFPTPAETRPPAYGEIPNCGDWPAERSADDLAVRYAGEDSEDTAQRWLAVYPDAATAAAELDALRTATADCAPVPGGEGIEMFFGTVAPPAGLASEDAYVYTEQARHDDGLVGELTLVSVYRTGNALLYDSGFGSAGGDDVVQLELARRTDAAAETVAAMCVFSIEGCSPDEPDGPAGAIPDEFPLLDGYPSADTGSGAVGPTRELAPMALDDCGARVEVPVHSDLLRAGFHRAGDDRERQVVTFADQQQAQSYLESVVAHYEGCGDDEIDGRTRLVQTITSMSGYDAAGGAHIRWERDGAPVPGIETVAVVRVGSSVLLSTISSDEGAGANGEHIQEQTQTAFEQVAGVVAAMAELP